MKATKTDKINVSNIPFSLARKVRQLAVDETNGKTAPMVIKLIQEAIKARDEKKGA